MKEKLRLAALTKFEKARGEEDKRFNTARQSKSQPNLSSFLFSFHFIETFPGSVINTHSTTMILGKSGKKNEKN